jgi:hypothetical protein
MGSIGNPEWQVFLPVSRPKRAIQAQKSPPSGHSSALSTSVRAGLQASEHHAATCEGCASGHQVSNRALLMAAEHRKSLSRTSFCPFSISLGGLQASESCAAATCQDILYILVSVIWPSLWRHQVRNMALPLVMLLSTEWSSTRTCSCIVHINAGGPSSIKAPCRDM